MICHVVGIILRSLSCLIYNAGDQFTTVDVDMVLLVLEHIHVSPSNCATRLRLSQFVIHLGILNHTSTVLVFHTGSVPKWIIILPVVEKSNIQSEGSIDEKSRYLIIQFIFTCGIDIVNLAQLKLSHQLLETYIV
jgi:hypothetical protein